MSKKLVFFSLLTLSITFALWFVRFCIPDSADVKAYQALAEDKKTSTQSKSPVYQTRQGVAKDLWYSQDNKTRVHHRLESESSVLTLLHKEKKIDALEILHNFDCWMQEKIYLAGGEPFQEIRFFSADEGTYRYSSQKLLAQSVKLSLYRLPGKDLPLSLQSTSPFLKGIAQDVSFSMADKVPKFQAENFKASLREVEKPALPTRKK